MEPGFEEFAYEDTALPIREGQTISQPYIVALMIENAEVKSDDKVLEVGAGSLGPQMPTVRRSDRAGGRWSPLLPFSAKERAPRGRTP